jgi:hypothetical protein
MSVKDPEGDIPEGLPESDDESKGRGSPPDVADETVEGDDPDKTEKVPDFPD